MRSIYTCMLMIFIGYEAMAIQNNKDLERQYYEAGLQLQKSVNLSTEGIFLANALAFANDETAVLYSWYEAKLYTVNLSNGEVIYLAGNEGKGPGEYMYIRDIEVDSRGILFMTDVEKQVITLRNLKGDFIAEYNQLGRFMQPSRIALCKDETIIYGTSRQYWVDGLLHKFDRNLTPLNTFHLIEDKDKRSIFHTSGGLSCDEKHNLYYTSRYQNFIKKFDADGNLIYEKEVVDFEPNKEIIEIEGRWTFLHKEAKSVSGEVRYQDGYLYVSFSGRRGRNFDTIDIYRAEDGVYVKSIKFDTVFREFDLRGNAILTISQNKEEEYFLNHYTIEY